jgi:hypothetical protein
MDPIIVAGPWVLACALMVKAARKLTKRRAA